MQSRCFSGKIILRPLGDPQSLLPCALVGFPAAHGLSLPQMWIEADKPKPWAQFNFHGTTFPCPAVGKGKGAMQV